jgi:hypothetical protein
VTSDEADENMPSWSRDGRVLYYGSNRTGRDEIWRVPVAGGTEEQVTWDGGFVPFESLDGQTLYYMKANRNGPLFARPVAAGEERLVIRCVAAWGYAVTRHGVLYLDCPAPGGGSASRRAVLEWDAVTGRSRVVARLEPGEIAERGLSTTPDGQTVAYARASRGSTIMMIDNFR